MVPIVAPHQIAGYDRSLIVANRFTGKQLAICSTDTKPDRGSNCCPDRRPDIRANGTSNGVSTHELTVYTTCHQLPHGRSIEQPVHQ